MRRLALLLPLLFLIVGCGSHSSGPHPATTIAPVVTSPPLESARIPEGARPEAPPVSLPFTTVPAMHIDAGGLVLIESFENVRKAVYCPEYDAYGGVWDIGFGEAYISPSRPCESLAEAQDNLRYQVESNYEWAIRALDVRFDQHEWDALCSFAYNLGAGIFTGSLRYDLQRREFYSATRIMLQYDHAGGVVLPGLRTRREIEVRLFLLPEPKPAPAKPSRHKLEAIRAALRLDLTKHRCRVAPYHGRGRYHAICRHWLLYGAAVNRQLRGG